MRTDQRDTLPHVLVIEERIGPEINWHVEHNIVCEVETWEPAEQFEDYGQHEPMEYYTCLVQAIFDGQGLEAMGDDFDPKEGRYEVIGVAVFDNYTGESDIWLERVE